LYALLGFKTLATNRPVEGALLGMSPREFPRRSMGAPLLRAQAVRVGLLAEREPLSEPIFAARRGRRSISNFETIESVLRAAGFRTVFAEDLAVAEQVRTIANAAAVFGLHGAALGYLMLHDPKEAAVAVEAFSCGYANNWARANCHEAGLSWIGCQGRMGPSAIKARRSPREYESESYELDVASVRAVLRLAEGKRREGGIGEEHVDECLRIEIAPRTPV
jgi:hypothetical protein